MKGKSCLSVALMLGLVLLLVACTSDAQSSPTPTPVRSEMVAPSPTVAPEVNPTQPATSDSQGSISSPAKPSIGEDMVDTTLQIGAEGDLLKFDKEELTIAAGSTVAVRLQNVSQFNQHNWVLVAEGTKDAVVADGINAGAESGWLMPGDQRVIAATKMLAPGQEDEVLFSAPPPGRYQFVCTFPGHNLAGMFGDLVVTP